MGIASKCRKKLRKRVNRQFTRIKDIATNCLIDFPTSIAGKYTQIITPAIIKSLIMDGKEAFVPEIFSDCSDDNMDEQDENLLINGLNNKTPWDNERKLPKVDILKSSSCNYCKKRLDLCQCGKQIQSKKNNFITSSHLTSKESKEMEKIVVSWIEKVLNIKKDCSLHQWLRSGVILCNLINSLQNRLLIQNISTSPMPKKQIQNIKSFLHHCEITFQVKKSELFCAKDLWGQKFLQQVIRCLFHLKNEAEHMKEIQNK